MNVKTLIRGLLTFVIWLVVIVFIVAFLAVLAITNTSVSELLYFVPITIGGLLTFLIWNEPIWQRIQGKISLDIKQNIANQLTDLPPDRLEEVRDAVAKVREKFGIDIALPKEKAKRDQIDVAIAKLSDSQLLDLKQGIQEGSINEDDLLDWLSRQEENASEM